MLALSCIRNHGRSEPGIIWRVEKTGNWELVVTLDEIRKREETGPGICCRIDRLGGSVAEKRTTVELAQRGSTVYTKVSWYFLVSNRLSWTVLRWGHPWNLQLSAVPTQPTPSEPTFYSGESCLGSLQHNHGW